MDHLYNIAPSGPARLHTAEEIREAAQMLYEHRNIFEEV